MKRLILFAGFLGALPLWGLDSVDVYLPTLKLIFSVDETPTRVPILDSTNYAYIALLKANVYSFNIVEVPSFSDMPPVGWEADTAWKKKPEFTGSGYVYPGLVYTYTGATGSHSLTSATIPLGITDYANPDTLRFTYKLTGIDTLDTVYVEVIKWGDDTTTCWTPIDILTSADITDSTLMREVQVLTSSYPSPPSCNGPLTDNDTVRIRFRFKDNTNLSLDTTKFFALYNVYVTGRLYRPTKSDTIPDASVSAYIDSVKSAFSGVPDALLNFVGLGRNDLKTKSSDKKVVILIAPLDMSVDSGGRENYLGYWDVYDTLHNYDIIFINTARGTADAIFGSPWDVTKLRRYLAFQYARLVAYSLDTTEVNDIYPEWFNQSQIAAKAAWIAHKVLRSDFGDPLGLAAGFTGATAVTTTDVPLITGAMSIKYNGKAYASDIITKVLPWIVHLEDLAGTEAIKGVLGEEGVPFIWYPSLANSLNNVAQGAGSNFYAEVEKLYLKELGAGDQRSWSASIPDYPRFTTDTVFNTLNFRATSAASVKNASISEQSAKRFSVNTPGRTYVLFDGSDANFVSTYVGGSLDTLSGFVIYKVSLQPSVSMEKVSLDERNRWSFRDPSGLRSRYYFLLINVGYTSPYSFSAEPADTLPPTITDFAVMPNAAAPEFVDVYAFSDSPLYTDAGSEGALVVFWAKNDSANYSTVNMTLNQSGNTSTDMVYTNSGRLSLTDIFGNEYFGPIRYRLVRAQNATGLDYVTSLTDTSGEIYRVRLGNELTDIIPNVLSMASTAGEQILYVFSKDEEYVFNVPVHAQIRVKADEGDRIFYFDGSQWKEARTYYYPQEGKAEAFVSGAYRIHVGKDKPSTLPVSNFSVKAELGKVLVSIPSSSTIDVKIYNPMGRLVKSILYSAPKAGNYAFELSNLSKGVYLVRVKSGKHSATVKAIVFGGER